MLSSEYEVFDDCIATDQLINDVPLASANMNTLCEIVTSRIGLPDPYDRSSKILVAAVVYSELTSSMTLFISNLLVQLG